jgi:DNA repair exonuclease SbcCD nuclease subunit
MRVTHTADWQIGKAFGFAPADVRAQLQEARNAVVSRIAEVARMRGVGHVLVAGDVWDKEDPEDRTLARPIEAMRAHPQIGWHLLPGNHDCHRPNGLWDRLRARGLPENVVLHCDLKPIPLEEGGKDGREEGTPWLLPAPITLRHDLSDTTAWMDQAETPAGAIRIGLAHGTMSGSMVSTWRFIISRTCMIPLHLRFGHSARSAHAESQHPPASPRSANTGPSWSLQYRRRAHWS